MRSLYATPSCSVKRYPLEIHDGVAYTIGVRKKKQLPPGVLAYFVKMGSLGGKIGGPALAAKLTPEQRSENARRAVTARWAKAKNKG